MSERPAVRVVREQEFVVDGTLRASPEKIFAAYTDPELVPLWWAVPGGSLRVEQMDVRPGGKYRFVERTADGHELVFVGTYVEVRPPIRLVYTFEVEGHGDPVTTTVDLEPEGESTRVTFTTRCASKEVRDRRLRYGAEAGAKAALHRLARVLEAPEVPER